MSDISGANVAVYLYLNVKNQRLSLIRTIVWYASTCKLHLPSWP